jgi:hypothetical protein
MGTVVHAARRREFDLIPPACHCCSREICPQEVAAGVAAPGSSLVQRVREIAWDVASLCDDLSDERAAACFDSLFGSGPGCRLYHEFLYTYRQAAAVTPRRRSRTTRQQLDGFIRAATIHRSRSGADA